ncbi:hypothetical protein BC830DRAFT_1079092 [Chytriomyces sp. MP71]|nr:hypothetical protein BC830DRAFT_1079092 [Chytriomyces sp. MP71]
MLSDLANAPACAIGCLNGNAADTMATDASVLRACLLLESGKETASLAACLASAACLGADSLNAALVARLFATDSRLLPSFCAANQPGFAPVVSPIPVLSGILPGSSVPSSSSFSSSLPSSVPIPSSSPIQTTSANASLEASTDSSAQPQNTPVAAIIGGVVAAIVVIALIAFVTMLCVRRRKSEMQALLPPQNNDSSSGSNNNLLMNQLPFLVANGGNDPHQAVVDISQNALPIQLDSMASSQVPSAFPNFVRPVTMDNSVPTDSAIELSQVESVFAVSDAVLSSKETPNATEDTSGTVLVTEFAPVETAIQVALVEAVVEPAPFSSTPIEKQDEPSTDIIVSSPPFPIQDADPCPSNVLPCDPSAPVPLPISIQVKATHHDNAEDLLPAVPTAHTPLRPTPLSQHSDSDDSDADSSARVWTERQIAAWFGRHRVTPAVVEAFGPSDTWTREQVGAWAAQVLGEGGAAALLRVGVEGRDLAGLTREELRVRFGMTGGEIVRFEVGLAKMEPPQPISKQQSPAATRPTPIPQTPTPPGSPRHTPLQSAPSPSRPPADTRALVQPSATPAPNSNTRDLDDDDIPLALLRHREDDPGRERDSGLDPDCVPLAYLFVPLPFASLTAAAAARASGWERGQDSPPPYTPF